MVENHYFRAIYTPSNIPESGVLRVAISDHYAVYCIRKYMGTFKRHQKIITTRKMKNFDQNNFLFDLSQVDWDMLVESSADVNEAVEKWSSLLSLIIEKHAPMRTIKVSYKLTPWLTTDFRKLARSRDKLKISAIKNKSSILMNSYKHVRNKVNNLKLKRDYFTKKIALYKGNLKETWKTINLLLNKRSKMTSVSCLDVADNNEIVHSMNDFFCSIGKKLGNDIPQQPSPYSVSVERALKKMKTLFDFGFDILASHFIKIAFPVILHSLCRMYNMSTESGIFPDSWKIALVAPILKSGSTVMCVLD